MKKLISCLICIISFSIIYAQPERYLNPIFESIKVTEDVKYATNATIINLAGNGEATPQHLNADIYEPKNDNVSQRPLVIVLHDGNFLPPVISGNIIGTKRDSAVVEICTRLAKAGYVAAAIDYRLGWNPLANTRAEWRLGFSHAVYRVTQDANTAVRFFKRSVAENNNPFGVASDRIALWGLGVGGYAAFQATAVDSTAELYSNPELFLDIDEDGTPDTPMITEAELGDIEGKQVGIGSLILAGDTLCYPNHINYISDIQLCIGVEAAIMDIIWLTSEDTPIIAFHSVNGPLTPYGQGKFSMYHSPAIGLQIYGSYSVVEQANQLGNNQLFRTADFNDSYTNTAKQTSINIAGHEYLEGLYPVYNPTNSFGRTEGIVIDWWDPDAEAPNSGGLNWDELPHPSGKNFHEYSLRFNENMSAEKARNTIDTLFGYALPRMYVALELGNLSSTAHQFNKQKKLLVFPSPAKEFVVLSSNDTVSPILAVELYDLNARLLRTYQHINSKQFLLHRKGLMSGIYIAKVHFQDGFLAKKVFFD